MEEINGSRQCEYRVLLSGPQNIRAIRIRRGYRYLWLSRCVTCLILIGALCRAQDGKQTTPSQPNPPATNPSPGLPPLQLDGNAALHHLNQIVNWYRHVTTGIHDAGLPSDAIYEEDAKSLGAQVAQLAFESAKAESGIIAAQQKSGGTQAPETTQQQSLEQVKAKTSGKIDDLQSQVEAINTQLGSARGAKRQTLPS